MPVIKIETRIKGDVKVVFDLARSIDLYLISTSGSKERAIAGKTSGLIEEGESVTWRAKHLGVYQNLTSKVTLLQRPNYFVDEMQSGAFKSFKHEHFFEQKENYVIMKDIFTYHTPLGWLGKLADFMFLKKYMYQFLESRNRILKSFVESGEWKNSLPNFAN